MYMYVCMHMYIYIYILYTTSLWYAWFENTCIHAYIRGDTMMYVCQWTSIHVYIWCTCMFISITEGNAHRAGPTTWRQRSVKKKSSEIVPKLSLTCFWFAFWMTQIYMYTYTRRSHLHIFYGDNAHCMSMYTSEFAKRSSKSRREFRQSVQAAACAHNPSPCPCESVSYVRKSTTCVRMHVHGHADVKFTCAGNMKRDSANCPWNENLQKQRIVFAQIPTCTLRFKSHTYIQTYTHVQLNAFVNIPSMYAGEINQSTRACICIDMHTYRHKYIHTCRHT